MRTGLKRFPSLSLQLMQVQERIIKTTAAKLKPKETDCLTIAMAWSKSAVSAAQTKSSIEH